MGKPCACTLDLDGRCAPCSKIMEDILRKYVMAMIEIVDKKADLCSPCLKNSADFAWAKLVREWTAKQPPEKRQFAVGLIEGFKMTSGLQATPLLDYELRKLKG